METDVGGHSSEPSDWYSCRTDGYGRCPAVNYAFYVVTVCIQYVESHFSSYIFVFDMFSVVPEGCGQADRTRAEGLCKGRGSG